MSPSGSASRYQALVPQPREHPLTCQEVLAAAGADAPGCVGAAGGLAEGAEEALVSQRVGERTLRAQGNRGPRLEFGR